MKFRWFKKRGLLYIPTSPLGWVILLYALGLAIFVVWKVDQTSHSASDTFYGSVVMVLGIVIVTYLVARLTSR